MSTSSATSSNKGCIDGSNKNNTCKSASSCEVSNKGNSDKVPQDGKEGSKLVNFDEDLIYDEKSDTYMSVSNALESKQYNLFYEFLKTLRPGVELFRNAVPVFLIEPISLLEKLSYYNRPNRLAFQAVKEKDSLTRFSYVLGWVISNWSMIPKKGISHSKPFNPILGEVFMGKWLDQETDSETQFISEQVSHHPPVSAWHMSNEKVGFSYVGWVHPKGSMSYTLNSLTAVMDCQFRFDIHELQEQYLVNAPSISVSGLWLGEQVIEVLDKVTMVSKQYQAVVEFFSGRDNYLAGTVYDIQKKQKVGIISGNLDKKVFFTDLRQNPSKSVLLYDTSILKLPKVRVPPVSEQQPNESRKVWHRAALAVHKKDIETASIAKGEVENLERQKRKLRDSGKDEWKPQLFVQKDGKHWVYKDSRLPELQLKLPSESDELYQLQTASTNDGGGNSGWSSYLKFW
jgi:hypothetical protein